MRTVWIWSRKSQHESESSPPASPSQLSCEYCTVVKLVFTVFSVQCLAFPSALDSAALADCHSYRISLSCSLQGWPFPCGVGQRCGRWDVLQQGKRDRGELDSVYNLYVDVLSLIELQISILFYREMQMGSVLEYVFFIIISLMDRKEHGSPTRTISGSVGWRANTRWDNQVSHFPLSKTDALSWHSSWITQISAHPSCKPPLDSIFNRS